MPAGTPTKDLRTDRAADSATAKYPSLRTALWLYVFVLIATAGLTISFSSHIDPLFLRFAGALYIAGGFTLVATYLSRVKLATIFGRSPSVVSLIASLLAGVALWIPVIWLTNSISLALTNAIGVLPSQPPTQATDFARFFQIGIVIPLCQGVLFWAFAESAAIRASRRWGVVLVALMFACYGVFGFDPGGISSVIGLLPIGAMAAAIVWLTGSAWCGIAIGIGANLGSLFIPSSVMQNYIGADAFANPLSVGWLLAVAVTLIVALILFQIARRRSPAEPVKPVPPRRFWWAPLILSVIVVVMVVASEITVRQVTLRPVPQPRTTTNSTGSTIPPIPAKSPTPTSGAAR